jgi:hypothetical protein
MSESRVDVTERLMARFDGRLPLDLVPEVLRAVLLESGDGPHDVVPPDLVELAAARLEHLAQLRVPAQQGTSGAVAPTTAAAPTAPA